MKIKFWKKPDPISTQEAIECILVVHQFVKKLTARCDESPELRAKIELRLGKSMEYVIGSIEEVMRFLDKNKESIDSDPITREHLTSYIMELARRLERLAKEL